MPKRKIMPADRVPRYFFYRHVDGSKHFKKFNDPGDIEEMVESDLVSDVFEVTSDQWERLIQPMTPEERAAVILSDNKIGDPRIMEGGVIRQLK